MKLGSATAFVAEAALWISGAALIASAAGMSWSVDVSSLVGSQASASASVNPSAGPSATIAVESLAPGTSPTMSPVAAKFLACVALPDFQIKTKFTMSDIFASGGSATDAEQNGTLSYKNGDDATSFRLTANGTVTAYEVVDVGSASYSRENGGTWKKSAREATDAQSDRLLFAPTLAFVDKGVEEKNGAQLHRLEVMDPGSFSKALLRVFPDLTDAQETMTVWVGNDGVPAAYRINGWVQRPDNGVSTRVTDIQEYRVISTSGVTITAPI